MPSPGSGRCRCWPPRDVVPTTLRGVDAYASSTNGDAIAVLGSFPGSGEDLALDTGVNAAPATCPIVRTAVPGE